MKIFAAFVFFLFSITTVFAQIDLDSRNKTIDYFKSIEESAKSSLFKFTNSISFDRDGEDQPLIYRRMQTGLPDLLIYYYPLTQNHNIAEIYYDWNEVNFLNPPDTHRMTGVELAVYLKKYKQLVNQIEAKYSKGQEDGSLDTSSINKDGLTHSNNWKTDSVEIKLEIELANGGQYPTHFIHLLISNIYGEKKTSTDAIPKEKVAELDVKAHAFLIELCAGKLAKARKFLSPGNDQQLNTLKDFIKDDKWHLGDSGREILLPTAKFYINLSYERDDNTTKPPLELLTFLFDEAGEIVAIQPMVRHVDQ